jgi:hypothetical protein
MKLKPIIAIILSIVSIATIAMVVLSYYHEHIEYKVLEKEIRQVHQQMDRDLPKELKRQGDIQKVITEYSFPNSYGVGDDGTEITNEFKKAGIVPEDQWVIVKETFIRSKIGVPFKLHRLIKLTNDSYKSKGEMKTLKAVANEFYFYKEYRGKIGK